MLRFWWVKGFIIYPRRRQLFRAPCGACWTGGVGMRVSFFMGKRHMWRRTHKAIGGSKLPIG